MEAKDLVVERRAFPVYPVYIRAVRQVDFNLFRGKNERRN